MTEYRQIEYVKNVYPLDVYTLELAWSKAAKRADLNLVTQEVVLVFKNGDFTLYSNDLAWQENAHRAFSTLANSPTLQEQLARRSQDFIGRIREVITKIKDGMAGSLVETHRYIQDTLEECILSFAEENFPGLNSGLLTNELHALVSDSVLAADLLNPKQASYFQKYETVLLAVALEVEKQTLSPIEIQKKLTSLASSYAWISAGFNEKPKDLASVTQELDELFSTKVSIKQLQEERTKQFSEALARREFAEKKLRQEMSPAEWAKVALIQALVDGAKYRIELGLELIYASRAVYEHIAREYGLTLKELKYLYSGEVADLLEVRLALADAKQKIELRSSKELVLSMIDGKVQELSDFKAPPGEATLKGQKAYGGVARGIVKIVNSPEDNHKVTSEDILVSSRTSPELVPAMAKARAIVSELGGMLCHAAIVSREMKKTCLVGVRNVTQILHDGDLIEVDADAGIVRIIK